MKKIIKFLNNYYDKAVKLSNDFAITRSLDWNSLIILNELAVQVGHIYNVVYKNEIVNEKDREFTNLGDELSDVILQLIALADSLKIDMYEIKNIETFDEKDWLSLPILLGQLNEAIMEKEEYRFIKPRKGFSTIEEFIKNIIFKLFIITYNISLKYNLDIEKEFELMLEDANEFLKRFNNNIEYINVYDDIHNFKGVVEKKKAHKLGQWHEAVSVLIFNPITQNVYFQLKNSNHNKINDKDLLETTIFEHLKAGEDLNDTVKKIKKETGLEVKYEDLILCGNRKCDMDNGMLIREFQYFYILPLNINLKDFKDSDRRKGIVQMHIKDALNLMVFDYGNQSETKIKKRNKIKNIKIKREDFDSMFLNNGVFFDILDKVEEYINKRLLNTKLDKKIKKQLNKIFRFTKLDKLLHKNNYYNDLGKTEKILDIYKDNITYTLIKNNENVNTNDYIVFLIIKLENKTATKQLTEKFNNKKDAEKYFNFLCEFINNNSNENIIKECYENLSKIKGKA